ncbi:hypothetical protein MYCTH_2308347 [Thermothelomyces thermophilus ATCC 42464]|uniref:Uncharacterized protein n=1 Tax=Thermothelomyces thermophilus (strain ATCC 42464 / BCRC 31852 / DSM 1799) TaxID=573729 RepID=G2QJP8_THET4|nr:uncharacterized protein MYCTH_2308347 [Thermothelomyces thermophilus ATCC 42464]AEO59805.1 hypothetical protein MYCTH_2308347 [Thermothelomyces thermophilus ATCC 42464]
MNRSKGRQDQGDSGAQQLPDVFHTPLGGFSSGTNERWLPLYGYQGVVWFRADLLYTFVDAVDRLLCLDNRAGVTYSLYLLDKRKDYTAQSERDEFLSDLEGNGVTIWATGPGDYSNDMVAWEWIVDRLGAVEDESEARQKVLFVAGPGDPIPWTWQPDESHRVLKVSLSWTEIPKMNRPDIAYLRMPENPEDVVHTNEYGPWIASVCRVLAAGRIPGRPGYPAIPDAWFTVGGHGAGDQEIGTYGGQAFLPQLWDIVVAKWRDDPGSLLELKARTGPEDEAKVSDRWHLFVPGLACPYEKQYVLHDEVDDVGLVRRRILDLVRCSASHESYSKLQSLEVYLPGTGFSLVTVEGPELVVSLTGRDDVDSAFQPLVDRMVRWRKWLESKPGVPPVTNGLGLFPQFLSIRPVFERYTIRDEGEIHEPVVWNPDTTTVARFRILAGRILAMLSNRTYSSAAAWIAITQSRSTEQAGGGSDPERSRPRLLISPGTTEEEWQLIRRMIVNPEVFISQLDTRTLPRFGDLNTEQPFGYRDVYETPDPLLYHAIDPDQIPATKRHYDWQSAEEDVSEQLKTLQPWEIQPESLSTLYAFENFPLRPPPGTKLPQIEQTLQHPEEQYLEAQAKAAAATSAQMPQSSLNNPSFRPTTDIQRGQRLREYSYAHPLDVHMHMSVPINAPPVDRLLDLGHNSVPVVSLSVLTPTEVRRLQQDYHKMRNLALSRIERCPYPGCDAAYPANQQSAMEQHLKEKHVAEKCNFCDEPLFAHWPPQQKYKHIAQRHSDILRSILSQEQDAVVQVPDTGRTDRAREGRWNFCSRCGRDHTVLDAPADRQHHDNVCYPGVQDQEQDWAACGVCGDRITLPDASLQGHDEHREAAPGEKPFCEKCAIPLGLFSRAYATRHGNFCKGHGRDNAQFCPWCSIQLADDFDARLKHIDGCARKPFPNAEGPIDAARRAYFLPEPSRISSARGQMGVQDGKRRKTGNAGEAADEVGRRPAKKIKVNVPPPRPRTRQERSAREPSDSPLSSPPSSSHSKRSAEAWLPPPPPPPPPPPATSPPPPPPATTPAATAPVPARSKAAGKRGKAKGQTRGGQGQKKTPAKAPTKRARAASAGSAATTRKTAAASKSPGGGTPAPAMRTRYRTRASAAAAGPASVTADAEGPAPAGGVSAKAARVVSPYADPLVRGASPARETRTLPARDGRRLTATLRSAGPGTRS